MVVSFKLRDYFVEFPARGRKNQIFLIIRSNKKQAFRGTDKDPIVVCIYGNYLYVSRYQDLGHFGKPILKGKDTIQAGIFLVLIYNEAALGENGFSQNITMKDMMEKVIPAD